jgi:uncharacterized membrane protein
VTFIKRGLLAGAAGTSVLNAATYLDMAWRGRAASDSPEQTVEGLSDRVGVEVPGRGDDQSNRLEALGALSGLGTGMGIGVVASWLRAQGFRLSRVGESVLIGAGAMALTDGSMAALGVSDPHTWTAGEWAADAVPHLLYGAATTAALDLGDPADAPAAAPARPGTVARAALLGVATGGRASAGVTALALSAPATTGSNGGNGLRRIRQAGTTLMAASELVIDKLPNTPSRTEPGGLVPRTVLGLSGGAVIARRSGERVGASALAGVAGALAASFAGVWWRRVGADKLGVPPLLAALAEDAVVAAAAFVAVAAE